MKPSNDIRTQAAAGQGEKPRQTVLFYSPDVDFCVSMRLLFQDRYHVVTLSDPEMLMLTVGEFHPYLMIVDSAPTKTMLRRFEMIKREHPRIHIMSFYAPQFLTGIGARDNFRCVDAAFSKPIDLAEVTKSMSEMMAESG
jgi:hypothetical protein